MKIDDFNMPFETETTMQKICAVKKEGGPAIMAAWSKDTGTMERRLKLALVYPDGEVSPIREYAQSKLVNAKALKDLADLDGIGVELIESIYKKVMEKKDELSVQADGSGKSSLREAYQELCNYVSSYEEPWRVFVRDGYGNILASYLPSVLDRLDLGYTRLELQKNFKTWGLIRVNNGTRHPYSYKINTGSANNWYFSFKLPAESEVAA